MCIMIIVIITTYLDCTTKGGIRVRKSHQRDEILAYLRSERAHRSASEIYEAVRAIIPNISLGTVYRNLGQLVESGEIITVETEDKFIYYDGYIKPHTHFVCRSCKRIYDFEYPVSNPEPIVSQGFIIERERTVYYGVCHKCGSGTPSEAK